MAQPHLAQCTIISLNLELAGSISVVWNIVQSHLGHLGKAMILVLVNG